MGLETGTYISDLVATNPTSTDPKSQGDDHIRLLKSTIKTTFPNVNGAVNPTPAELNALVGAASTGASIKVVTQALTDNSTNAASTAFVTGKAFQAALPAQTGNAGKYVTTDGANASWVSIPPAIAINATAKTTGYTAVAGDTYPQDTTSAGFTVTLPASPTVGDAPILICDIAGKFGENNLTLGRNGNKIMGLAEDCTIRTNNAKLWLIWSGATYGWRFF